LNPRLRQLVWPATTSRSLELVKVRYYDLEILKSRPINPDYQADADRRNQAIDEEQEDSSLSIDAVDRSPSPPTPQILKRKLSPASSIRSSEYWDRQNNLRMMNEALAGVKPSQPSVRRLKTIKLDLPPVNIAAISVIGYRRNL
jgi:hypothetical protein